MEAIANLVSTIDGWLWGWPLIILLFGTHVFLTFRLKFIQRHIGKAIKLSVTKDDFATGDVSQFSALATALAATIGTGNIVGVATAIALGGPGAVFWCWMTGVFGISTKYAESLLAVKYRVKTADGTMAGGPMYVLEYGMKNKPLAYSFAFFGSVAAFGIGNTVQANSISNMMFNQFDLSPHITGIALAVLTGIVIIGGVKRIASVCDKLVPFMAVFYVIGCTIILVMTAKTIPATIGLIVSNAFTGTAATGGFAGSTIMLAARFGVARGLFSNESGLGSAPIVAAAAQTRNPVRQALVASSGTFWDTVIVCAITGITIVNSGVWNSGLNGGDLTNAAFTHIPVVGPIVLTIGLLTFVFSTILGWSYYGEKCFEYLFHSKKAILPYRIAYTIAVYFGAVMSLSFVWDLADLFNGLMAIPNLISLLALSGVLVKETKEYLWDDNLDKINEEETVVLNR
ncbi:sodium:alanine symporter family protein [Sedimentibacter hydroxybenzoicus DSM 7310]|uniref:Sodium:alanine symporter family protein n=1 Tax=Sedimentibacter hydroxybenzoicus DSM 7310 TaxID=1123245 RepID=A0A974BGU6_SEDHY|nr:sodium:alanine symporter family protein [Sedimentibacter hydroxybenzoicus]NYB72888.1 sodium:alanine symporter family protein [Sedimentibacter hydroxybenzoicus DSM 7310]